MINKDIRVLMVENEVTGRALARHLGYSEQYVSMLLRMDLTEEKHTQLVNGIKELGKEKKHGRRG